MKKKVLQFFVATLLLFGSAPVWAYSFSDVAPSGQTLYYKISGTNVIVTYPGPSTDRPWYGYTMPNGDLTIPSSVTYNGTSYSVVSIDKYTFRDCNLTSVIIPNSVTSIDGGAFSGCSNLGSVTIPNSVTSIGNYAFDECGFTSISIPNSVNSIGNYAFNGCSNLTSVTFGNSVSHIGHAAFMYCNSLTSVHYTGDVSQWCGIEFSGSYSNPLEYAHHLYIDNNEVTSVTIPDSFTSIGDFQFRGCRSLNYLTIPSSVTSIGEHAFHGCSNILTIVTKAVNPPSCGTDAFTSVPDYITLTVPCGSLSYYYETEPWKSSFPIKEEDCSQSIEDACEGDFRVWAAQGRIHLIAESEGEAVIYDIAGHPVSMLSSGSSANVPAGIYLVKVGTLPARKVVLIR